MATVASLVVAPPSAGDFGTKSAGEGQPRAYTGAAHPGGDVHFIGGLERQVGGWGSYEIDRRAATRMLRHRSIAGGAEEDHPPGAGDLYPGRRYIGALDAAGSILSAVAQPAGGAGDFGTKSGGGEPPVAAAIERLYAASNLLENAAGTAEWWDQNGEVSLPTADLEGIAERVRRVGYATPEQLKAVAKAAGELASAARGSGATEPVSQPDTQLALESSEIGRELLGLQAERAPLIVAKIVSVQDSEGVGALEEACRGYVGVAEHCAARTAAYAEKVAAALEKSIRGEI